MKSGPSSSLLGSFPPNQTQASQALRNLEKCIADSNAWMNSNSLQLNHSKCEFMLFGSKSQLNKLDIDSISISGNDIPLSNSCRNLGVIFYSQMSKAAFMLILRGQNQRFETLIQNADPKRRSREYCLCFPREEDDFVSMHCALFEAIVRAQVNRKGVYMTSFKRGYM